jgi:uncharacterized protein YjgD (DUF1641 family)
MAVPISTIPKASEFRDEIQTALETARVSHAKALLSAYELLQQLHDARSLDILRGALDAGDTLVTKVAAAMNTPESIKAVRNLVSLARILGSVDPDVLHNLADELTAQARTRGGAPRPSLWRAIRVFAGADSRRALVGGAAFLQAFGRALRKENSRR